jgi:hypothetical protein
VLVDELSPDFVEAGYREGVVEADLGSVGDARRAVAVMAVAGASRAWRANSLAVGVGEVGGRLVEDDDVGWRSQVWAEAANLGARLWIVDAERQAGGLSSVEIVTTGQRHPRVVGHRLWRPVLDEVSTAAGPSHDQLVALNQVLTV